MVDERFQRLSTISRNILLKILEEERKFGVIDDDAFLRELRFENPEELEEITNEFCLKTNIDSPYDLEAEACESIIGGIKTGEDLADYVMGIMAQRNDCPYVDGKRATFFAPLARILCTEDKCPYGDNLGGTAAYVGEPARICKSHGLID